MSDYIIKLAATQGIWTVLSMFLIIYILKNQSIRDQNQSIRDQNYRNTITSLMERDEKLDNIEKQIEEINTKIIDSNK